KGNSHETDGWVRFLPLHQSVQKMVYTRKADRQGHGREGAERRTIDEPAGKQRKIPRKDTAVAGNFNHRARELTPNFHTDAREQYLWRFHQICRRPAAISRFAHFAFPQWQQVPDGRRISAYGDTENARRRAKDPRIFRGTRDGERLAS